MPDSFENLNIIMTMYFFSSEMETKKSRRTETGQSRRMMTDAILVFCLVTGIIVTVGVIFAMVFMILHW